MPKGKKFNAAEEHFEKKCVQWRKQIVEIEREKQSIYQNFANVIDENNKMKDRIFLLEQKNKELMDLHGLSESDVENLIKGRNTAKNLSSMSDVIGKYMPYY